MKNFSAKTEKAYKFLIDEIVEGRLFPGQRLVERDLVEKLGMSKTPVREALIRLKQDGLVDGSFNQSVFVTRITLKDALEIYDLREVLEGLAAKTAALKITPERSIELGNLIKLSERFCEENRIKEYAEIDLEIHNLIGRISENQRLCDVLSRFRNQSRVLITNVIKILGRGGKVSLREHKAIVDAICKGKPELAERRSKKHIHEAKKAVISWLESTVWEL